MVNHIRSLVTSSNSYPGSLLTGKTEREANIFVARSRSSLRSEQSPHLKNTVL